MFFVVANVQKNSSGCTGIARSETPRWFSVRVLCLSQYSRFTNQMIRLSINEVKFSETVSSVLSWIRDRVWPQPKHVSASHHPIGNELVTASL